MAEFAPDLSGAEAVIACFEAAQAAIDTILEGLTRGRSFFGAFLDHARSDKSSFPPGHLLLLLVFMLRNLHTALWFGLVELYFARAQVLRRDGDK